MTQPQLFFVYGTLRRGDDNDITQLFPAPRFIGQAIVPGTMYHFGGYPGVTLGGQGRVVGEVYEVSAELEARLDAIEAEYPTNDDKYEKRAIQALLHGQMTDCFVYEIDSACTQGKPVIESGDWVKDR